MKVKISYLPQEERDATAALTALQLSVIRTAGHAGATGTRHTDKSIFLSAVKKTVAKKKRTRYNTPKE